MFQAQAAAVSVATAEISPALHQPNSTYKSPITSEEDLREPKAVPVPIVRYITAVLFGEGTPLFALITVLDHGAAPSAGPSFCVLLFRPEGGTGTGQTHTLPLSAWRAV